MGEEQVDMNVTWFFPFEENLQSQAWHFKYLEVHQLWV
jgi:hypothetical protein